MNMMPPMQRALGRADVVAIGLNAIVGSGIFLLPDDLYRQMGLMSPLSFLLCALGLLPVALCFAEAASQVDRSGGPYIYAADAFGPLVGFGVGWMAFANSVFSYAAVASAASAYLIRLIPSWSGPWSVRALALLFIAAFSLLNYRGARPGAAVIQGFTASKFLVLLVLVGALLPHASLPHASSGAALPEGIPGIGKATFMALFALQGFEVVPVPAGETRAPHRTVPWAVMWSLLAASALYVVVQCLLVGSYANLDAVSDTPLADAALSVAPALASWVTIGGLVSTLGFVSGSALGTPRYLAAMALDRHVPYPLGAIHAQYAVPHRAVVVTGLVTAVLVIPFDYRSLIGMSNVAVAVQYLATCLAVPVLRRRGVVSAFRAPGGRWTPALGALVSLWIVTEASLVELSWASAALAVGVALALTSRRGRSTPAH